MMIIAHRGASGTAPENTLAAFRRAIEDGAHGIELDVRSSRDGKIIVFHDETLDRTTDGTGLVHRHTLAQLKRLDAGSFFGRQFATEKIPHLAEVIQLTKSTNTRLFIELKQGRHLTHRFLARLIQVIRQHLALARCVVMSFHHDSLKAVKLLEPRLDTVLLVDRIKTVEGLIRTARTQSALGVGLDIHLATGDVVGGLRQSGLMVIVWTVNSIREMRSLIKTGVDGITTDYPKRLKKLML